MEEENKQKSYLSFKLGKETFASSVSKVVNILEMPQITEVPQTPDYMVGVMNVRGEVLPVIDSRTKFGMEPTTITSNTCVLVLEIEVETSKIKIGAIVDSVEEVLEIEEDDIKSSPTIGTKYNTEFILGMVQKNESFIMILDMERVFSSDDIVELTNSTKEVENTEELAENKL